MIVASQAGIGRDSVARAFSNAQIPASGATFEGCRSGIPAWEAGATLKAVGGGVAQQPGGAEAGAAIARREGPIGPNRCGPRYLHDGAPTV
jgi:hypothetical protein